MSESDQDRLPPLNVWGWTDRGQHHPDNQDSIFPLGAWPAPHQLEPDVITARGQLMAVADGVTSASLGAAASRAVIAVLVRHYYHAAAGEERLEERLVQAIAAANAAAWDLTRETAGAEIAATTLVAAVAHHGVAWVAHTGDSRAYRITGNEIRQLTTDHSVVQELLDAGAITPDEALDHPEQGALTRALGLSEAVQIDLTGPLVLGREDALLLCSDGLSTLVPEAEMARWVRRKPAADAARGLVALANRLGGFDNISAVVARHDQRQPFWRRWL